MVPHKRPKTTPFASTYSLAIIQVEFPIHSIGMKTKVFIPIDGQHRNFSSRASIEALMNVGE